MNKKIKYILVLVLSMFITANVSAQTCNYVYASDAYGRTSATIEINGNSAKGVITSMNRKSQNNHEKVQGWADKSWNTYGTYLNKNQVCPYYLLVETSGNATLRASYDYNSLAAYIGKFGVSDEKEAHICVSTTIKEDKKTNGDAYNEKTDSGKGDDKDIQNDDEAVKTCAYKTSTDEVGKFGTSSGYLKIYDDGTVAAYVTQFKGVDQGFWTHDHFGNPKLSNEAKDLIKQNKCPYYMIADYNWNNSAEFTNTRERSEGKRQVMVSSEIAENKKDYDPSKDGENEDLEKELERANEENEKAHEKVLHALDQDDPFNGEHIGEDICHDENIVRALKALGVFIVLAKFAIPMIIIIFGTIDFIKVVMAGTEKSLSEQAKSLGMRVVIGLGIFFAPTLVNAFLNGLTYYQVISEEARACQSCLLDPFNSLNCKTVKGSGNAVDGTSGRNEVSDDAQKKYGEEDSKGGITPNQNDVDAGTLNENRNSDVDANNLNDDRTNGVNTSESNNGNTVKTTQTAQGNTVKTSSAKNTSYVLIHDPDTTKQANIN
jgi:hypothetical protein